MDRPVLLSSAYFAPVQYYARLAAGAVLVERHEHYGKQSYRNRCTILTAGGPMNLTVPVVRGATAGMPITEVQIAWHTAWQKLHFRAIEAAYRRSPFYQFYIDELTPFFSERHPLLYDFNAKIQQTICRLLGLKPNISETDSYIADVTGYTDLRDAIHPKPQKQKPDKAFVPLRYGQVFDERFGFTPNLSILDLLFNEGPEALKILRASLVQV